PNFRHAMKDGQHLAVRREYDPPDGFAGIRAGEGVLLPPRSDVPEAVFREGARHQPFAIRAEGGPGRPLLRLAEVKIVGQLPRPGVPDLDPSTLRIPGGQPSAIRAEGGISQTGALEEEVPAGVFRV